MKRIIFSLLVGYCLLGCNHSNASQKAREALDEDWEDLIGGRNFHYQPSPDDRFEVFSDNVIVKKMPAEIANDKVLRYLALSRFLEKPEKFGPGLFGNVSGAGRFVAFLEDVPNWDQLYWVQVLALSKKYACFIVDKSRVNDETIFECRNKRLVKMWRSRGDDWIEFYVRQYDQSGKEILR